MSERTRLVLIGAGQIGAQGHLPAVLACEEAELVAIVDAVKDRAARLVNSYGLSIPVFTQIAPALTGAHGAIIATPNETHFAVATECLRAGVPVLIEKPMTETYTESVQLIEVVRATGKSVMVGYVTRYRPNVQLLRSLLDQKYFGKVKQFAYQYGTVGGWSPLSGYATRDRRGGGVLAVTGSHFLDRMIQTWGYPVESEYSDDGNDGPEANAVAHFVFKDGMLGSVRCSKTAQLPGGLVLESDEGRLVLRDNDVADLCLYPVRSPDVEYFIKGRGAGGSVGDVFAAQVRDFAGVCRGRPMTVGCDVTQGSESVRLMDELYGKRQSLPDGWYVERARA